MKSDIIKHRNLIISAAIYAVYAVITLIGATHHELWFDEAQAWGIARDATLETLPEILKHEGHPALWYLILMPFAQSGAYCEIINIISWFFSVVAAGLFMWKAPFGLVFKTAMLFSSGFLFFNSVNARVYCLIPLLLFLIAIVYPKREKYAPVYGLLVGLLANTHIMMCGLVGILGIFMLIELYKNIKKNGLKKSGGQVVGLVIAGVLVIAMILPLLGSLSSNNMVQNKRVDIGNLLLSMVSTFKDIGINLMVEPDVLLYSLFGSVLGFVVIAVYIKLFCYKKAFIMGLFFLLMYSLTIEVIWFTTPLRAPVFVYTLVAIFWIAVADEQPRCVTIPTQKSSAAGKRLIPAVNKFFSSPQKTINILLCVILFSSTPAGAYWLIYDCGNDSVMTEAAGEFIKEELPENSVIITSSQTGIQFSVYSPQTRFYSLELQRFITYTPHEIAPDQIDYDKVAHDLMYEKDLYYLSYSKSLTVDLDDECLVFYNSTSIPSYAFAGAAAIYKVELSDILPTDKE
ncbi:MAG: hypothetical protein MR364_05525 [Oscillospiraceae bacterium]|nr:hypothetical protein [Oscillospiraceae bacterium]